MERSRWVDEETRQVERAIFFDPGVHALEIERIFNRTWLYLGHESELPNADQFVTRRMGADNVILSRGRDGVLRAFLNTCRHRGAQLCRADSGSTQRFVCPYHAWSYDTTGALRSTSFDRQYDRAEFKKLGLKRVPKLDSYHGLIFGNWDEDAPPLAEHLGDLAWYLDLLFGSTPEGSKVLTPPQRWVIETNWKIPPLNFMDTQHAMRVHKGPLALTQAAGGPPLAAVIERCDNAPQVSITGGHGLILISSGPPGVDLFAGYPAELIPLYEKALNADQFKLFATSPPSVGTIFPNVSWVGNPVAVAADEPPHIFLSLRLWQPIGANRVEIWNWSFAPKDASDATQTAMQRMSIQNFGAGGVFEEDDAEIWATMLDSLKGSISSRQMCDFSAGRDARPMENPPGPGTYYASLFGEQAQFGFLRRWNELMDRSAQ